MSRTAETALALLLVLSLVLVVGVPLYIPSTNDTSERRTATRVR
jgi:hypothetical protein